ncbi:hypothetical protein CHINAEXTREME_06845 [Halobiforma lacisalsi AJ5]|uniref:Uncharacterized protein n=1 Tax=Natronobacterium lacisalsi AJ5 TaxID=358396 RepID=M0LXQ1_NATLA|nr:hypothetical protein [Halobiforma lacisalsi]APW97505.1 hypothetical protein CHINAEXTREME_06845 [Halobiforma lacisalsi AJ5]EMA37114.1 hypothetical protein C445_02701 [Halobiforma lacisalsi AJ5]
MSTSGPFFDDSGTLDDDRLFYELVPIAKLVALFGAVAAVPFLLAAASGALLFTLLSQFVLAVGSGVVLLHVVVRGVELADE